MDWDLCCHKIRVNTLWRTSPFALTLCEHLPQNAETTTESTSQNCYPDQSNQNEELSIMQTRRKPGEKVNVDFETSARSIYSQGDITKQTCSSFSSTAMLEYSSRSIWTCIPLRQSISQYSVANVVRAGPMCVRIWLCLRLEKLSSKRKMQERGRQSWCAKMISWIPIKTLLLPGV